MMLSRLVGVAACVLVVCVPAAARAQDLADDPGAGAAMHFGPLALTPRLVFRNVGFDSNVLNAAGEPQPDFTATFVPGADSWLNVGRTRLSSKTDVGYVYFQHLADQRSFEFNEQARFDVFLTRLVPHVAAGWDHTSERPNLEIDQRALHTIATALAGVTLELGARTHLVLDIGRRTYRFDETNVEDAQLAVALNRTEDTVTATMRVTLTPLTTFVLMAVDEHDRFDFSPLRNSDSVRIEPGFEFKPFALVSGRAMVGYRRFDALDPSVPDYSGPVASVDVSYVMRETTHFAVAFNRDVDYSYEPTAPYYVENGGQLTITQALGQNWDLVGRGGRTSLTYRGLNALDGSTAGLFSRQDVVTTYGLGVGRRVGTTSRVGIDADRTTRTSVVPGRNYTGFRVGGSVTYGF